MQPVLPVYYLLLVGNLMIYYFLGTLGLKIFRVRINCIYSELFCRLLLGTTIFIVASAIFFTGGRTVMLGFILIGAFPFLESKLPLQKTDGSSNDHNAKNNFTPMVLLELLLVVTIFYLIRYFITFNIDGVPIHFNLDHVFYAKTSYYLVSTGTETSMPDFLHKKSSTNYPYHYFELWLNGAGSKLFRANYVTNLLLVTYTVFSIMLYLGYRSIFNFFVKKQSSGAIISFLSIFYAGIFVYLLSQVSLFRDVTIYLENAITLPKLLPIFLFLTGAFLLFLYRKYQHAFITLLCLPVISVTTAPAVLTTLSLLSIGIWIFAKQRIEKKLAVKLLAATFLIAIFIAGFYSLFGNQEKGYSTDIWDLFLNYAGSIRYWKTFFNILIGTTLQIFTINILLVFGLIYLYYKNRSQAYSKPSFLLGAAILSFYMSSLFFWGTSHILPDSVQLFTNLSVPLIQILNFTILVIIIGLHQNSRTIPLLITGLLFITFIIKGSGISTNSTHSENYLKTVQAITKELPTTGGFIKAKTDYNSYYSKNSETVFLGSYLNFMNNEIHVVNLSIFDIPINKHDFLASSETELVRSSNFYQFVRQQIVNKQFRNTAQSQIDFIRKYNIRFVIISAQAKIPPLLKGLTKQKIIDPLSGERFLLLK